MRNEKCFNFFSSSKVSKVHSSPSFFEPIYHSNNKNDDFFFSSVFSSLFFDSKYKPLNLNTVLEIDD